jgi:hypothetical protein
MPMQVEYSDQYEVYEELYREMQLFLNSQEESNV